MKIDILKRWIKALESGEYKFGRGKMYNVKCDTHCALGVLVELALADGVDVLVEKKDNVAEINGNPNVPPATILNWAGIDRTFADKIASINDRQTQGFSGVIAKLKEMEVKDNK